MIAHVFDDLFDPLFLAQWEEVLLNDVPMVATNLASEWKTSFPNGTSTLKHKFFGMNIFEREGLNRVTILHPAANKFFDAFQIIEENLFQESVLLQHIDVNLQFLYQDGGQHQDGEEVTQYTIMVMNNTRWKPEWGGHYQVLSENGDIIESHDYVPGRIIIFPDAAHHRGLAPSVPNVYRYTTAFRVTIEPEQLLSLTHDRKYR